MYCEHSNFTNHLPQQKSSFTKLPQNVDISFSTYFQPRLQIIVIVKISWKKKGSWPDLTRRQKHLTRIKIAGSKNFNLVFLLILLRYFHPDIFRSEVFNRLLLIESFSVSHRHIWNSRHVFFFNTQGPVGSPGTPGVQGPAGPRVRSFATSGSDRLLFWYQCCSRKFFPKRFLES